MILLLLSCKKESDSDQKDAAFDPSSPVRVTDFAPLQGGLGSPIVINGENFGNDTSKVEVYFNNKKALILNLKQNNIYALVPKQPGDSSIIKVVVKHGQNEEAFKEGALETKKFAYNIRATVTTVAGVFNEQGTNDGSALEAKFTRPSMLTVTDDGNVFISDDNAGRVALLSLLDNKVVTLTNTFNYPWQSATSIDQNTIYVTDRNSGSRPNIFKAFYREDNWLSPDVFYDQKDASSNFIMGSTTITGLAASDKYVYQISQNGSKLIRTDLESREVKLIGQNLNLSSWNYLAYNKKDGCVYIAAEEWARVYKFNTKNAAGEYKSSISNEDLELVAGLGRGSVKEGVGSQAQFGYLSGIACDGDGNIYTCDYQNHVIWKITNDEHRATVFAGKPGVSGYKDGAPKESEFNSPYSVTSTSDGILYVADMQNRVIRSIAVQ